MAWACVRTVLLLTAVMTTVLLTVSCAPSAESSQVPVRLQVTNRTTEPVTVRWKDNKLSGESAPIPPGQVTQLDLQYTTRGAGDLRVQVLGPDGQRMLSKRFPGDELRASKFARKLTVSPPRPPGAGA